MSGDDGRDRGGHWTHRLFVDNARLYLPFLEAAVPRAEAEVGVMVDRFSELGIPDPARGYWTRGVALDATALLWHRGGTM